MMTEGEKLNDIYQAFCEGLPYLDRGFFRYTGSSIQIIDGIDYVILFENGLWYISGDARTKVLVILETVYVQARKALDDEKERLGKEFADKVLRNNETVLGVLNTQNPLSPVN